MRHILLNDFNKAEEMDDGLFLLKIRNAEEPGGFEQRMEVFSEGDIYKIKGRAPEEADAIAFTDDWVYYSTQSGIILDYVFRD